MLRHRLVVFTCALVMTSAAVGTALASSERSTANVPQRTAGLAPRHSVTLIAHQALTLIPLSFGSASQVHRIDVMTNGPATVEAASEDCCIPNDHWATQMIDLSNGNPSVGLTPRTSYAVGTGRIDVFSGNTFLSSVTHVRVVVTFAVGVDVFPAGMTERIEAPPGSVITLDF